MSIERIIKNLRSEVGFIYSQRDHLSENLFFRCSYCRKKIIESIIEEVYCDSENKCPKCKPLIQKSIADVAKLFEGLHLGKDMLQQYFESELNRRTLIAILNGIFTIGPNVPCAFPQACSFELTYRCNLKCKHCYIGTPTPIREMNTKNALQLIEDIAEAGFVRVPLSGGEPLLRDDLLSIAKEVKSFNMEVILSTNGTLLSVYRVKELKKYIDLVCVSLDSQEERFHDGFRGVDGAQKMTLSGIRNCLENDLPVRLFTTLTKLNYGKLPELIDFIGKLGIRDATFFDLNPVGKGATIGSDYQLSVDEFKTEVITLDDLGGQRNVDIDVLAPFKFHKDRSRYLNKLNFLSGGFCNAGISTLNITPNGYIQPCSRLRINLGNARTEKIKEIWRYSPVLEELRDRTKLKGACGKCEYKYLCGGCRANAYSHYSDYLMEDPRCI